MPWFDFEMTIWLFRTGMSFIYFPICLNSKPSLYNRIEKEEEDKHIQLDYLIYLR